MSQISTKRKIVNDGVFFTELNEFFTRELGVEGYSGVKVLRTAVRTEIIIRATKTQDIVGEKHRRIRELTSLVQKRFNFPPGNVVLYADRVSNRALSAIAQAESIRYKLLGGLAVRRACYGVLKYIMENGAKGCELIVSGKLRAQRAKAMKFKDGYMITSGDAASSYVDTATRSIKLKQGVLGIKVRIMLPHDPTGVAGTAVVQPDVIEIREPKPEQNFAADGPRTENTQHFNELLKAQAAQQAQPMQQPDVAQA